MSRNFTRGRFHKLFCAVRPTLIEPLWFAPWVHLLWNQPPVQDRPPPPYCFCHTKIRVLFSNWNICGMVSWLDILLTIMVPELKGNNIKLFLNQQIRPWFDFCTFFLNESHRDSSIQLCCLPMPNFFASKKLEDTAKMGIWKSTPGVDFIKVENSAYFTVCSLHLFKPQKASQKLGFLLYSMHLGVNFTNAWSGAFHTPDFWEYFPRQKSFA